MSLDLRLLTAAQAWRFGGFAFLALATYGVLPGYFAWPAGLGDMAIGATAPLMAVALVRRPGTAASRAFRTWQVLGILDLVVAVGSAAVVPLLFPVFAASTVSPTAMTRMPLVLIPGFLVPGFIILHLISLLQARRVAHAGNGPWMRIAGGSRLDPLAPSTPSGVRACPQLADRERSGVDGEVRDRAAASISAVAARGRATITDNSTSFLKRQIPRPSKEPAEGAVAGAHQQDGGPGRDKTISRREKRESEPHQDRGTKRGEDEAECTRRNRPGPDRRCRRGRRGGGRSARAPEKQQGTRRTAPRRATCTGPR